MIHATPQQYALVAQMLQQSIPQMSQNRPGRFATRPMPDEVYPGFTSFHETPQMPFRETPQIPPPGVDFGSLVGQVRGSAAPALAEPGTVFGRMRQALPAATRSNLQSHRQALVTRFMHNAQSGGVRK